MREKNIVNEVAEWRYWVERAEEARTMAEEFRDPEARAAMLEIARGYEHTAKLLRPRSRKRATEPASLSGVR